MARRLTISALLIILLATSTLHAAGTAPGTGGSGTFYTRPALFSYRRSDTERVVSIDRFGPVGIGFDLYQPAFVMKISNIEAGSPAATSGKLKVGQIVETINGEKLHDIDSRIQLGNIIEAAEATDGMIKLVVRDDENAPKQEVVINIPVLGAYSKTWPLNCPKSDKIVRNFADHYAEVGGGGQVMLVLLSTGDERDLDVVKAWARKAAAPYRDGTKRYTDRAHAIAHDGIPMAEYYLRTGDKEVLPMLQAIADSAERNHYHGGYGARGGVPFLYFRGGQKSIIGTHVCTFVILAKMCGVDMDEFTLQSVLKQSYRFAGRGNNPYGDQRPEGGFTDNGKNGILALTMAAAAALTPNGEKSLYARARDVSAVKAFYSNSYMLHGHTGGGIGETWRAASMGFLYDKCPEKYREFMDNRKWHYDMSRRFNGTFGILDGASYGNGYDHYGASMALSYTMPRKHLVVAGGKPKFGKTHRLPERPWGTEADDVYLSLDAAKYLSGKAQDLKGETHAEDSGLPRNRKLAADDVSDEFLRAEAHHQDHTLRASAAGRMAQLCKYDLIFELLQSRDPRVRRAGATAVRTFNDLNQAYARGRDRTRAAFMKALKLTELETDANDVVHLPPDDIKARMFELLGKMIGDPDESWWTIDEAMLAIGDANTEEVAPFVDDILPWLENDEWWLRYSALKALTPVAADERFYRKVLPAIGTMIEKNERANTLDKLPGLINKLQGASPKIQEAGIDMLAKAYLESPDHERRPGGPDLQIAVRTKLDRIAGSMAIIPGGLDRLYEVSQKRYPDQVLSHRGLFLNGTAIDTAPHAKKVMPAVILQELVPEHVGRNRARLRALAAGEVQSGTPGGRNDPMQQLVDLHARAGNHEYEWQDYGTDRHNNEWDYFTFDPPEKREWDVAGPRYRQVTYPKGMENWYAIDFDTRNAGWKKGQAPFANLDGKLPGAGEGEKASSCNNPACGCSDQAKTLWDKEVLLMRREFDLPPVEEGHRYRLLVGGSSHVGVGDGFRVYINGKQLIEVKSYGGRGSGGNPDGAFITREFFDDFKGGKVSVAATSFLRRHHRWHKMHGNMNIWFQQMKVPPIGDDLVVKSAEQIPMLSSEWQILQDPESTGGDPDDGKYRYDGKFVANRAVVGEWQTIGQVASPGEFKSVEEIPKLDKRRAPLAGLTLKDNGETDNSLTIWTGDTLIDIDKYQALKMKTKKVGDKNCLLVEAGGFNARSGPDWKCPWYVMVRE